MACGYSVSDILNWRYEPNCFVDTLLRAEPKEPKVDLTAHLSLTDMQGLAGVYFKIVKPELGLLEEVDFTEELTIRFKDQSRCNDFDAVALGVAALGSFFSSTPHPNEETFVLEARRHLVQSSIYASPSPNHVAAWALRTIYLRLTSRPHAAWLSSCVTMHQIEASGLHKEMQTIAVVYPAVSISDHRIAKTRRRLFWIARALNTILSFEYGRTRVNFDVVTTKRFAPDHGGHAHQFVELADLLPTDCVDREKEPDPPAALVKSLNKIEAMKTESKFISMLKADLAFAIYRRLWLMSLTDAKDRADTIMTIGKGALTAAAKLLETKTPWWNLICSPFQFLCVLIAVGTPKSLGHIPTVMELIRNVARTYDTHMVQEASAQAAMLVNMARKRKQAELDALNAVPETLHYADTTALTSSSTMSEVPNLDWMMDLPFEWDMFLNPDLVVSSQHSDPAVQSAFGNDLGMTPY